MIQDPATLPLHPRRDVRTGASALTRFVERRLASRYGWDLDVLQERKPVFPGSRVGGEYRVLNPLRHLVRPWAGIESLHVAEWLRFGNSVRQLTHVFALAERWGSREVRLPARHSFYCGPGAGGIEISWGPEPPLSDLALSGYFMHVQALMSPLDESVECRIVDDYVRPLLSPDLLRGDPRVGAEDLVMHFRGGDTFDIVGVNPGYWQPPLAYYLAALERERAKRVWLVFEDRRNPTVAAAEEALRSRGVEIVLQSAALADDVRVLLSARKLVASTGTFVPALALLSEKAETFYHFSANPHRALAFKGLRLFRAYDADGGFVASVQENWGARPEQLETLVSYPIDRIRIEPAISSSRTTAEAAASPTL